MDKQAVFMTKEEWIENPYWAKYYEEAPSKECKQYIALEFYYSDTEDEEAAEAMDKLEPKLSLNDWKHLYAYCANNPRKGVIAKKIAELE